MMFRRCSVINTKRALHYLILISFLSITFHLYVHQRQKPTTSNTSLFKCPLQAEIKASSGGERLRLVPAVYSDDRAVMKGLPALHNIPRIFHFMWKTDKIPSPAVENLLLWRRLHPNWTFVFWTDKELDKWIGRFLANSGLLTTFRKFPSQIFRADFARYVILYVIGGVYADIDAKPLRSLEPLLSHHSAIISREVEANAVSVQSLSSILASNFLMASRPGHPFWPLLMARIKHRGGILLYRTGPMVVNEALKAYRVENPIVFHDASIFLAPSLYFNPPVSVKGDALHIKILKTIACPNLKKRKDLTWYAKFICDTVNKENRIDYRISYQYPRQFNFSFTEHQMFDTYGPGFAKRKVVYVPIQNLSLRITPIEDLVTFSDLSDPFELDKKIAVGKL